MGLTLITPPLPAVSWAKAKAHLRHEGDEEQVYVESLIAAATAWIDGHAGWLGRALMPQTWDLVYDQFPCGAIKLPLPPTISVGGVFYIDPDTGAEVQIAGDRYVVDTTSHNGWVIPAASWPQTMRTANAARIRFTAGYSLLPASVPASILMMVAFLYDSRGEQNSEMPKAAQLMLSPLRVLEV